jgi:G3E family GTPase
MQRTDIVPVDILTGFLGSGKSTLLNRLLKHPNLRDTAIIVNEIGEIGLDHLLVETQGQEIALIDGGCLCCSVADSLPETLLALCSGRASGQLPAFKRIVIETTGLADPAPISEVIRRSPLLSHFLSVGRVICTVDVETGVEAIDAYVEIALQLAVADRVVLTKTDCVDREACKTVSEAVAGLNPIADQVDVGDVDPTTLFDIPASFLPVKPQGQTRHTHGIKTRHLPVEATVTLSGLNAWISVATQLWGADLIRCKGVVSGPRGRWLLQGVQGRYSLTPAPSSADAAADGLTFIFRNHSPETFAATLHWLSAAEGTLPPHPKDLQTSCSI